MLVRYALKTGIAASILAGIFQHSDLAHIQYPVMGLVATMLSSNLGDNVKAGWGRLGGSVVAGVISSLLVNALGLNPFTGGLAFVLSSLFCEVYQWKALTAQAGVVSALIATIPDLGKEPWQYTFERVSENGIGVIVATVVSLLFWPDNPRQTLQNQLVRVLQNCKQIFSAIVERALKGEGSDLETDALIAEITEIVQQSESLLNKSMYGIVGKQLVQDNWSDLIATERRLRRHLWAMTQTIKKAQPSLLMSIFAEDLTHLAEKVSTACEAMTRTVQTQIVTEIPRLEAEMQNIGDRISHIRTTGETSTYALTEIIQVYNFLNILGRFIQELEQLAMKLETHEKIPVQPIFSWRFQSHPLPLKQVKHILKTGVALGLTLAIINFAQLPFGYYAAIAVVVAMQPTLGKGIDAGKQRVICTGIGALVAVAIVNTFGGNSFTVGLGVVLTILICSYFGFTQGYKPGCFLVTISIMVHGSQPNIYIWGRFSETMLGFVIAFLVSLLIWPETASEKLDPGISQTFVKLASLYEMVVNRYLQGLDSRQATASLQEEIRQSILTQSLLQAETKLEPVDDFKASKQQRRWNFLISYEKALFSNILSLQNATGQGDRAGISQKLHEELQASVQMTVFALQKLAAVVTSGTMIQAPLISLDLSVNSIEQKLEQLRPSGFFGQYSVGDVIALFSVVSNMQEIAENLEQLTQNLPAP